MRLANLRGRLALAEAELYRWTRGFGGAQGTLMGDIVDHRRRLETNVAYLKEMILEIERR